MPENNTVQIQCPSCGNVYQTPIRPVIDVGANPALRQQFLSGQVNLAICPKCNTGGLLETPLVYHDPGAEFLAVYFPAQLSVPEVEKQKMIGDMTQALMRSLPPEQRKGYFLNPRQFANRQSLLDAILGTMGISQEELDRQRKKMKLAEQFLIMADDPKGLQMMAKGNDGNLDVEFFSLLSGMLQQAEAAGDQKSVERIEMLRENLLPLTSFGKRAAKQRAAVESLKDVKTADEFLDRVMAADPDELPAIAMAARPLMDYSFFQSLTERLEASQGPEHERLVKLRDRLVEMTQQLDEAAREGIEAAVKLLQEIVNSPSPRSAVRERAEEIDELFMNVLAMNLQEAERRGDRNLVGRLQMVYDEVAGLIEESYPPEVQLINELLRMQYPEGTREYLRGHHSEITPGVIDLMGRMADDMAQREGAEAAAIAKRLRDVRAQAMLMV